MNRTFFRAELKHNLPGFEWAVRKHTTGDTFFEAAGRVLGDVDKSRRGTFRGRKILATAYVYYNTNTDKWCVQLEKGEPGTPNFAQAGQIFGAENSSLSVLLNDHIDWLLRRADAMRALRSRILQASGPHIGPAHLKRNPKP